MKALLLAVTFALAIQCRATATEGVRIELRQRADEPRYVELTFHNDSKEVVELEIPVEGAGGCYRYFEIEAVTLDGAPVQKHTLYAPAIPPYVVKLKPGGIYIHRIQPGAYPNATEVQKLRKLRVKYTNPLTAAAIVSDWLVISQK